MDLSRRTTIVDYYDVSTDAVGDAAEQLWAADPGVRPGLLTDIATGVRRALDGVPHDQLPGLMVSMVDDLYRCAATTRTWSSLHSAYVNAVWGAALCRFTECQRRVEYVVDNDYADNLTRPLGIYPDLFRAAGFVYVCPQHLAWQMALEDGTLLPNDLPTAQQLRETVPISALERTSDGRAMRRVDEGRQMARSLVDRAIAAGRHLVYLEADGEDGALDFLADMAQRPDAITIIRRDAPTPHTTVRARGL